MRYNNYCSFISRSLKDRVTKSAENHRFDQPINPSGYEHKIAIRTCVLLVVSVVVLLRLYKFVASCRITSSRDHISADHKTSRTPWPHRRSARRATFFMLTTLLPGHARSKLRRSHK